MKVTTAILLRKLENIEKEVHEIREHMVDIDSIMTEDDHAALLACRKEAKAGKLIPLKQVKKELEL